jgi:predicted nucleotidyltransferase
MNQTPYPAVNEVLANLLSSVKRILGDQYIGLYLYGSLAGGDFNPQRSDIDFVVVTRDLLTPEIVAELEEMHTQLNSGESLWARKLEGVYIPRDLLRRHDLHGPDLPTVNEGNFYLAGQGSDWVLQRSTLREQETIVDGPSIREFIDPVSAAEMQSAVRQILEAWWAPMLQDPSYIKDAEYQTFVVLSMCRALYTLRQGAPVSKSVAARWAVATLEQPWPDLVTLAARWERGQPFDHLDQVLEFMRYSVEMSRTLP